MNEELKIIIKAVVADAKKNLDTVKKELKDSLVGGRINKIYQPEKDEIHLVRKNQRKSYRLLLSASASLPLIYLTNDNKPSPMTAPNFCMLLRKHIQNGRITSITQPGLERIIRFQIEHLDEMGDLCTKTLIIELMGKHSNIIFTDDKGNNYKNLLTSDVEAFFYNEGYITWNKKNAELTFSLGKLETAKNYTKEQAIDIVYNDKMPKEIDVIVTYWMTATTLFEYLVNAEMEKYFAQMPGDDPKPTASKVLELNADHKTFNALKTAYSNDKEKAEKIAKILYAQSLLIAGLQIEDPVAYCDLVCELF